MMQKPFLLFSAVVLLSIAALPLQGRSPQEAIQAAAQAPTPATPAKNSAKPNAESQAKAKSLYQIDCAMCHGDNGNGKTDIASSLDLKLGDLTNPATLANKTDADLFAFIRAGKDKMPAEAEGRASDTELRNLILYIRSFSKP
jgi:mono/diheme cytochrome c family protein